MADKFLISIGENETMWHSSLSFRVKERPNSKNKEYLEFGGRKFSVVNISGKEKLTRIATLIDEFGPDDKKKTIVFSCLPLAICFSTIRKPMRRKLAEKGLVIFSLNMFGFFAAGGASGAYPLDKLKQLGSVIKTYTNDTYGS